MNMVRYVHHHGSLENQLWYQIMILINYKIIGRMNTLNELYKKINISIKKTNKKKYIYNN
jgi:hypothetical protein